MDKDSGKSLIRDCKGYNFKIYCSFLYLDSLDFHPEYTNLPNRYYEHPNYQMLDKNLRKCLINGFYGIKIFQLCPHLVHICSK